LVESIAKSKRNERRGERNYGLIKAEAKRQMGERGRELSRGKWLVKVCTAAEVG
jgi:hypothetical protein